MCWTYLDPSNPAQTIYQTTSESRKMRRSFIHVWAWTLVLKHNKQSTVRRWRTHAPVSPHEPPRRSQIDETGPFHELVENAPLWLHLADCLHLPWARLLRLQGQCRTILECRSIVCWQCQTVWVGKCSFVSSAQKQLWTYKMASCSLPSRGLFNNCKIIFGHVSWDWWHIIL